MRVGKFRDGRYTRISRTALVFDPSRKHTYRRSGSNLTRHDVTKTQGHHSLVSFRRTNQRMTAPAVSHRTVVRLVLVYVIRPISIPRIPFASPWRGAIPVATLWVRWSVRFYGGDDRMFLLVHILVAGDRWWVIAP